MKDVRRQEGRGRSKLDNCGQGEREADDGEDVRTGSVGYRIADERQSSDAMQHGNSAASRGVFCSLTYGVLCSLTRGVFCPTRRCPAAAACC
jgi:hypothetical protein